MTAYNMNAFAEDFASRTHHNMTVIERHLSPYFDVGKTGNDEERFFEVTHLINCLLGLIVFPYEQYENQFPKLKLSELEARGWPHTTNTATSEHPSPYSRLEHWIYSMRNAIAHRNVGQEVHAATGQVCGLCFWTHPGGDRNTPVNWRIEVSLTDFRTMLSIFSDLVIAGELRHARYENGDVIRDVWPQTVADGAAQIDEVYSDRDNDELWNEQPCRIAVRVNDKLYPGSYLLQTAAGLLSEEVQDTGKVSHLFEKLGFEVISHK